MTKDTTQMKWLTWGIVAGVTLCLGLGCSGQWGNRNALQPQAAAPPPGASSDPFFTGGERIPATRVGPSEPAKTQPNDRVVGGAVGTLPPSSSVGPTTASLATNSRSKSQLDGNLNIDAPASSNGTNNVQQSNWNTNGTTTTWTGNSVGMLTVEQAFDRLQRRGATRQRLELRDGQWFFSCSIPNPQNPRQFREYEMNAGDSISAMKAVLEQVEGQR